MKLLLHLAILLSMVQSNIAFSINDIRIKFSNLEYEIANLKLNNHKLTSRIAKLESSSNILESSNVKLTLSNHKMASRIAKLESSNNKLESSNINLTASNLNLTSRIAKLESSNNNLESSNIKLTASNHNLTSIITDLQLSDNNLISSNQNLVASNHTLSQEIKVLQSKLSSTASWICGPCVLVVDYQLSSGKYTCDCLKLKPKRDCLEFYQAGIKFDGIYNVTMNSTTTSQVYCDQTTDRGGWTVIQRRIDGSTNFYRNWIEYKNGFGNYNNEFYFGNDMIHSLTFQGRLKSNELRIDMKDWNGNSAYAKYSSFKIESEKMKYQLRISGYSGNAGDSLARHNSIKFSTYDQDNSDGWGSSCAQHSRGAWWYEEQSSFFFRSPQSNLNGEYLIYNQTQPAVDRGIIWKIWKGTRYSLKSVEIKVRRNI